MNVHSFARHTPFGRDPLERYAELGIAHYWIVDPEQQSVECFRLENGAYRVAVQAGGNETLAHPDWNGLVLDLEALWR